jgi:drug/metabolite transporter (DMT)-like permease
MLVFGTLNTVIMKMQDEVVVGTNADGSVNKFTHPYFQCAVMFLGELFCLVLYGLKRMCASADAPSGREGLNPLVIAFPAMFDICGSSLMFVALTMCAASVYQMMRGVIVVITAMMALFFLGRAQYAHHWTSLALIVFGVFLVGFVNIMATRGDTSLAGQTSIFGIVLLLIA